MSKHSPGPWSVGDGLDDDRMVRFVSVEGPDGMSIADLQDNDNAEADARLIAAAPEMLELLEKLTRSWRAGRGVVEFNAGLAEEVRSLVRRLNGTVVGDVEDGT